MRWVSPWSAWVLSVRLLALCHLAFFASFLIDGQHLSLLGSSGIVPLCDTLDTVRSSALYDGERARTMGTDTMFENHVTDTAWWVRATTLPPPLAAFHRFPTLFWLSCDDRVIHTVTWVGVLVSFSLVLFARDGATLSPPLLGSSLGFLAGLVLSFVSVGDPFVDYPWDHLLIEFSVLMALSAPIVLQSVSKNEKGMSRGRGKSWLLTVFLARLSVTLFNFRLMFGMGLQKFLDMREGSEWRKGTYIHKYLPFQPMPTPAAWYLYNADVGTEHKPVSQLLVGMTFVTEIVAPLFVFFNAALRSVAVFFFVALMLGISLTGNFGVFQLLTIAACIPLLDGPLFGFSPVFPSVSKPTDNVLSKAFLQIHWRPATPPSRPTQTQTVRESPIDSPSPSKKSPGSDRIDNTKDETVCEGSKKKNSTCQGSVQKLCVVLTAVSLLVLGAMGLAHFSHFFIGPRGPGNRFTPISTNMYLFRGVEGEDEFLGEGMMSSNPFYGPVLSALRFAAPLHLSHKVGIFRDMPPTRYVTVVEGSQSLDGPWKRYLWKHQMNILQRPDGQGAPSFLAPYLPRFDFQIFCEGGTRSLDQYACLQMRNWKNPTRPYIVRWLMDNPPEVTSLVAVNPFHGQGRVEFVRWGYVSARFSTREELQSRKDQEEGKKTENGGEEEQSAAFLSPWWTPELLPHAAVMTQAGPSAVALTRPDHYQKDEQVDMIRWTVYSREKIEDMIRQGTEAFKGDTASKRFPCMAVN